MEGDTKVIIQPHDRLIMLEKILQQIGTNKALGFKNLILSKREKTICKMVHKAETRLFLYTH